MNLEEYFARIHYEGSPEKCDFQTLKDILWHHIMAIPFDGLSLHCGEFIELDLEVLYNKIVRERRGGWCYEQNQLLYWVLKTIGYKVTMHGASNYLPLQEMYSPNLTHLVLLVTVNGRTYIFDGSYGFYYQIWEPVELISGQDYPQGPGIFHLTEVNGVWHVDIIRRKKYVPDQSVRSSDALREDGYRKLYRFTLLERTIEDFQQMNTFLQTCPDSLFKKKSLCSLQLTDGLKVLMGLRYIKLKYNYKNDMDYIEFKELKDEEVEMVLREEFNIVLKNKFVPVNIGGIYVL